MPAHQSIATGISAATVTLKICSLSSTDSDFLQQQWDECTLCPSAVPCPVILPAAASCWSCTAIHTKVPWHPPSPKTTESGRRIIKVRSDTLCIWLLFIFSCVYLQLPTCP
ncbi:hypothetical protein GDO81_005408 [Engystomops pustulosus]|uniref:Uncharacterized protein n=1 Tax=Engystomops pustulosus TaxID=76066 RepID=A0AAV7CN72_ENGPU|nr:hypothetical protein GDO81_005408 [Engystomops pustulosus]